MKTKQTKSVSSIIIFLLIFQNLFSQNYLITFSGSGQSTTIEAVEVKNIAQQTTLTLSGTDTLLLTEVVGTGHMPKMNKGMIIYPNPANHSSRLEFYNSIAGKTNVEIYDFSGRLLIFKSIQLDVGNHDFTINGLKAGIYLVKVNTPEIVYSQRLVSTSALHLATELQYEGISQSHQQAPRLKTISNIVAMQYNDGERLAFKANSGDYTHTRSLIPSESQNIDFEFIDCFDGDGNHYTVVTIGEQVWMAENLKTTTYRNGTAIPNVTEANAWSNLATGAYVWYNNDISWKDSYGALYNWFTTVDPNELCPTGWHVPTHDEWTGLTDYIGGTGSPHGNELKSCRQVNSPLGGSCNTSEHPHWEEDTYYGNYGKDDYGFSSLPGGCRVNGGATYGGLGYLGIWWTSTEYSSSGAWARELDYHAGNVHGGHPTKRDGYSVRCLRD